MNKNEVGKQENEEYEQLKKWIQESIDGDLRSIDTLKVAIKTALDNNDFGTIKHIAEAGIGLHESIKSSRRNRMQAMRDHQDHMKRMDLWM